MSHKYIKVDGVGFIVWPRTDVVTHLGMSRVGRLRVISAGFCKVSDGKAICYGRSESLNIDSDEQDSDDLTKQLFIFS